MKTRIVTRLTLLPVMVILVVACASSPRVSYYSLCIPAKQPVTTPTSTQAISVGPVILPDVLKQSQIATGGHDGRFQLAEYHRWSGEVDRDVARAIAEQLAARLGTQQVAIFPWDQQLDAAVRVQVDILFMGGELGKDATLQVRWTLVDAKSKATVATRYSALQETLASAGHAAWVAAQQRNVAKLGDEIAAAVKETTAP
jgi:hypothetical protein